MNLLHMSCLCAVGTYPVSNGMTKSLSISRFILAVGFACLFFAPTVSAQKLTNGNFYFGYSYLRSGSFSSSTPFSPSIGNSNLNGWDASLELKFIPWLGAVADFGGNYGTARVTLVCEVIINCQSPVSVDRRTHSFLFGPRLSVRIGKFTPFGHGLVGAVHTSANGFGFSHSDTSFGSALGGGLDYQLVKSISLRLQTDDMRMTFLDHTQNELRLSAGLVFHF